MLRGGETVLVAVSGGADSVALLDVLVEVAPVLGLRLSVMHVDHDLRAESGDDADVARAAAERLGVAFHLERVSVRRGPRGGGRGGGGRGGREGAPVARGR